MKHFHYGFAGAVLAAAVFQIGCSQMPPVSQEKTSLKVQSTSSGTGVTVGSTIFEPTTSPGNNVPLGEMGGPVPGLTPDQLAKFNHGKYVFSKEFPLEPHDVFNERSCAACHGLGGLGGAGNQVVMNYISIPDTSLATLQAGAPLGNLGFTAHIFGNPEIQPIPAPLPGQTTIVAQRLSTMSAGGGFMSAVPAKQIEDYAAYQATKLGYLGITGRAAKDPTGAIGRFGWKNRTSNVAGFTGGAHVNELGASGPDLPIRVTFPFTTAVDPTSPIPIPGAEIDPTIDMTQDEVDDLAVFTALTMPPAPKYFDTIGYGAFKKAGCIECHWDGYTTTTTADDLPQELKPFLYALGGGKRVPMYSDMLAHNMGTNTLQTGKDVLGRTALGNFGRNGLADGMAETDAGDEFRTAMLWGLRFKTKFLHNGSASTLEEAIQAHYYDSSNNAFDSEANEVIKNYNGKNTGKPGNLSAWERSFLIRFLQGL